MNTIVKNGLELYWFHNHDLVTIALLKIADR